MPHLNFVCRCRKWAVESTIRTWYKTDIFVLFRLPLHAVILPPTQLWLFTVLSLTLSVSSLLLIGGRAQQAASKCSHFSVRMPATHCCGSMLKSGISHSKSCSCGRRELLQKSLNNHVFPLIYSKYLRREQIKALEEAAHADEAAVGLGGGGGGSRGNTFVLIRRKQYCCNY